MWPRLAVLTVLLGLPGGASFEAALPADDECLVGADCGLSALQRRGQVEEHAAEPPAEPVAEFDADTNMTTFTAEEVEQAQRDYEAAMVAAAEREEDPMVGSGSSRHHWHGWSQGGDKMWGAGTGMEVINADNVGYYDKGMYAARKRCGGAGCALITNPSCCRSVNHFHIHLAHYKGYGSNLKSRAEKMVCGKSGWHSGHLPCHGKVAFFGGFPAVFTQAMAGGHISHASVIAWPGSCGGSGTIVQIAYHCSIEHQIRGDFKKHRR